MGQHQPFKWYRIVGHPYDSRSADFIYHVETTSSHNVIKYHGKRQECLTDDESIIVQFPSHEKDVHVMPSSWVPEQAEQIESSVPSVVRVLPATHYICECGKHHVSDFPYPSMWCSCGKKARRIDGVPYRENLQERQTPPMEYR